MGRLEPNRLRAFRSRLPQRQESRRIRRLGQNMENQLDDEINCGSSCACRAPPVPRSLIPRRVRNEESEILWCFVDTLRRHIVRQLGHLEVASYGAGFASSPIPRSFHPLFRMSTFIAQIPVNFTRDASFRRNPNVTVSFRKDVSIEHCLQRR